jgi:pimeloyl-ACP methyl ester carboxylesterase
MSAIALIHGYAVRLTSPVVRRGFGDTAGLRAFAEDLRSGSAAVFRWGLAREVPWWALLDPIAQYRFYRAELATALSVATQARLQEFLERERPTVIVAHSMGATLLHAYARAHSLPPSVRAVVMVQADLPWHADLSVFPAVFNLYCPWDPTLLASSLLSWRRRAGTGPLPGRNVTNRLLPAYLLPNLHTSALRDRRLRQFVIQLLGTKPEAFVD